MLMEPSRARGRLDPRSVLLALLAALAVLLITTRPLWLLGEAGLALVLALLCGAARLLLASLRASLILLLLVVIAAWLEGGTLSIVLALARLLALFAASATFFALVSPEALSEALRQWGLPFRVAFVVGAALRFIPLVMTTARELREAQEARGLRFEPFWRHLGAYVALLLPLLRELLLTAERLAQALEARGFSSPQRRSLAVYRLGLGDLALLLASAAAVAGALLLAR
jgi:energy-coupling factor transporter transmembrane protein EcfT